MRPYQLIYLADLLREHREGLEDIVKELAERGEPISELEARLIVEAGTARLEFVEGMLRSEGLHGRAGLARLPIARRLVAAVTLRRTPRIGILRHYPPKPLQLPESYFRLRPPEPALLISLVTPSYQQGRFLDRTLYSVVSQGYPALEYVVQDGGSSDETVDVLRHFAPLLTSWRSEPDAGQADAINRGFEQTSGEVMAWLNSDDLLLPGTLAYVARYFANHPDVDVVYGNRIIIDESDGQIGAWVLPEHDDVALTLADFIPQETLFWRRRIWEAAGGEVDPSFAFALDWDLLLRFREAGATMVRLPRFLGAFRVHAEQKTTVDDAVGQAECERLRKRVHGRPVSIEEVVAALKPYLDRHVRAHNWQRLVDRLPLRRAVVRMQPLDPALRAPAPDAVLHKSLEAEDAAIVSPLVPRPDVAAGVAMSREAAESGAARPASILPRLQGRRAQVDPVPAELERLPL